MSVLKDWIALTFVPGLGVNGFWRLVDYFGSPGRVLGASQEELLKVPLVRESQITGFVSKADALATAERELSCLEKIGGNVVTYDDEFYPALLKDLSDPPPVLYVCGDKNLLCSKMISIVGSRAATVYGRRVARQLGRSLAGNGLTVVSGLALGIDTESHLGALDANGPTVGVLGCGLDIVYPRQNLQLFKHLCRNGALVSEYPLGTKPEPFRFPARNRIIAGMGSGVVVVEATRKSGSLITAQIALDLNREIFAVPGQVDSVKSEGTHWLLQQGAKLVSNADDIVEEIIEYDQRGLHMNKPFGAVSSGREQAVNSYEQDFLDLLDSLDSYPRSRDDLLHQHGLSPARLSEILLLLELDGRVEILPGNQIRKI